MKKFIFIVLLVAVQIQNVYAGEVFNKMEPGKQNVYFNFEFDPTFAVVAGYARSFEIKAINRSLTLTGDITFPIFLMDLKHYRVEIGSRIPFFNSKRWNIHNRFSIINKGTDNSVYFGNVLSIEEGLLFGYFSNKWYVAGEFDYEKFLLTHIENSNWYRENVYAADAKDGWYSSTGGKFTFGLQGGYTFRDIIEFPLRFGMYKTCTLNQHIGHPCATRCENVKCRKIGSYQKLLQ